MVQPKPKQPPKSRPKKERTRNGPPKGQGGRPPKFDVERAEAILTAVRAGNYLETASAFAGVDPDTLRRWIRHGARQEKGQYADFCGALKKAQADAEAGGVARIATAATKQWQAAAWLLERKSHEKWGKKQEIKLRIMDGAIAEKVMEIVRRFIPAERWDDFVRELHRASGDAGVGAPGERPAADGGGH